MPELYRDDIADPDDMQNRAADRVSDHDFGKAGFIAGSDPDEAVERIRAMEEVGGTVICMQLIGQADPMGTIRTYGERVLPALRSARAG